MKVVGSKYWNDFDMCHIVQNIQSREIVHKNINLILITIWHEAVFTLMINFMCFFLILVHVKVKIKERI